MNWCGKAGASVFTLRKELARLVEREALLSLRQGFYLILPPRFQPYDRLPHWPVCGQTIPNSGQTVLRRPLFCSGAPRNGAPKSTSGLRDYAPAGFAGRPKRELSRAFCKMQQLARGQFGPKVHRRWLLLGFFTGTDLRRPDLPPKSAGRNLTYVHGVGRTHPRPHGVRH